MVEKQPSEPTDLAAVLKQINERLERIEAHVRIHRQTFSSFMPWLDRALNEIREAIHDR